MSKVIEKVEWLITWVERLQLHPWGRTMIALVVASIVASWGWFTNRPRLDIAVFSLVSFAAALAIAYFVPILLARFTSFPFCVSVPAIGKSTISFQAYVLVLNRRDINMVMTVEICCKETTESPGHWFNNFETQTFKDQLGGHEKTEGTVRILSQGPDMPQGNWYMRVTDMVSRRKTPLFKITGCYPPNEWITSNQTPVFTQTPEEEMEFTLDHAAHLAPSAKTIPLSKPDDSHRVKNARKRVGKLQEELAQCESAAYYGSDAHGYEALLKRLDKVAREVRTIADECLDESFVSRFLSVNVHDVTLDEPTRMHFISRGQGNFWAVYQRIKGWRGLLAQVMTELRG